MKKSIRALSAHQSGFMLLETVLALVIVSAVAALALSQQMEDLKDVRAELQGKAMLQLQVGANAYITQYRAQIVAGVGPASVIPLTGGGQVANIRNPTINDLNRLPVDLPPNFSPTSLTGGNYFVRITTSPVCDVVNCQIGAIAWIDQPFLDGGTVDYPHLALAARAIGVDGGYSTNLDNAGNVTPAASAEIRGLNNAWRQANPIAGGNTAGILAVIAGHESLAWEQYVRRDGQTQMTGNLQVGNGTVNNDIVNLRNLTADETVASKNVTASQNVAVGGNVTANGNIAALSNITGNTLTANTRTTTGDIDIRSVFVEGQSCPVNGLVSRNNIGMTLSCQDSVWRKMDFCTGIGGGSDLNMLQESGCYNGNAFGNPPEGSADWFFVEVMRNGNPGVYYTIQRASGMTGLAANRMWTRSQQSGSSGTGWGPWKETGSGVIMRREVSQRSAWRWANAVATCDPNEEVTGGGGSCTAPGGWMFVAQSVPSGNGWFVQCDTPQSVTSTATAYAMCAKK